MASEKSLKIIEDIKTLTILELADLVKAVEEETELETGNDGDALVHDGSWLN